MSWFAMPRTSTRGVRRAAQALALMGCAVICARPAAAMEQRTFAVSWFGQATNSDDNDCGPGGPNPGVQLQYVKDLADLGYTHQQVEDLMKKSEDAANGGANSELMDIMRNRGRVNGQAVNAYTYPAAVVDPHWKALVGKYAYGFNLDGKGTTSPAGFEDPETHEKGINNELYRADGCYISMRGSLANRPTYWAWAWGQLKDSAPAWIVTVAGNDLSKDGPVTVTFDRALEHLKSNVDGSPRTDVTFRLDGDPRSHNVLHGELKAGMITISDHSEFHMMQNPLVAPEFRLKRMHMRLHLKPDGSLDAFIGGYQPWSDLYFGFASGGSTNETCFTGDIPGLYWLMRRHADGDPDPNTGQNTTISATYYMEAVPAFVAEHTVSSRH